MRCLKRWGQGAGRRDRPGGHTCLDLDLNETVRLDHLQQAVGIPVPILS